jgi:hypothetical protein
MDVAAFGTLHDKINIGVIFKAADIVDKRPGEAILLQYAGGAKSIIIETNFSDIKIIRALLMEWSPPISCATVGR